MDDNLAMEDNDDNEYMFRTWVGKTEDTQTTSSIFADADLDKNVIFSGGKIIELADIDGLDSNIKFHQHSEEDLSSASQPAEELGDLSEQSLPRLDTASLVWSFGVSTQVEFLNLTKEKRTMIFFAAAHDGVLYDYVSCEMQHLRGHQNSITSVSIESSGKYLATADAGPDNCIIIWDLDNCNPIRTIFNANPGGGTDILQMSCNGKYLINVTNESTVKFWLWTLGHDEPSDTYTPKYNFGKAVAVAFNPNVQEHFMIAFEKLVVFLEWNEEESELSNEDVPEIRKRYQAGMITDCTYVCECNECMASTDDGCILVYGNALNITPYKRPEGVSNEKIFIKIVKISKLHITSLKYVDGFLATSDVRGNIIFYDRTLRIMYWCQDFKLPAVNYLSFNMDPRKYKFEDPYDLDNTYFTIPSPRQILDEDFDDISEEYEVLYKSLVPSDATIHRPPFIVRDFIVATEDGNISKIDYIHNTCEGLFDVTDSEVAAIDVHEEEPYLVIAYKAGRVSLYNYETRLQVVTDVLPEVLLDVVKGGEFELIEDEDQSTHAEITTIKYSPQCFYLAVGRNNGETWFVDPIMLQKQFDEPLKPTKHAVSKICFSNDSKYFAFYDINHTVFVYLNLKTEWEFRGKMRSHYKPLVDMMFTSVLPYELYTIGMDRYLVKYDIENSDGSLEIETRERIDQNATPNCFVEYGLPDSNRRYFMFADDQYKLKIFDIETKEFRHVFLGPAYGCFSESPINKIKILTGSENRYLMFSNDRHIGIQILPPDGNPYKYTGTIGHPKKLLDFCISMDGQFIFTIGKDDFSVFMWRVHTEAVENLCQVGGGELTPFYCLIEGGSDGWLFTEMQNLFYYMQILHQGENSVLPRKVTDRITLSELADLMRACGYYPTEFEVQNMLNDIKYQNADSGTLYTDEITFVDFVRLYINHRPAHGISMDKLREAFTNFTGLAEYGGGQSISAEEFSDAICQHGESFTPEGAYKCLTVLMHFESDDESENEPTELNFEFLPQDISFEALAYEILGIDMSRGGEEFEDEDEDRGATNTSTGKKIKGD